MLDQMIHKLKYRKYMTYMTQLTVLTCQLKVFFQHHALYQQQVASGSTPLILVLGTRLYPVYISESSIVKKGTNFSHFCYINYPQEFKIIIMIKNQENQGCWLSIRVRIRLQISSYCLATDKLYGFFTRRLSSQISKWIFICDCFQE